MSDVISVFTDGACRGNPGPGGWAALLRWKRHERLISGREAVTTNNRMEIMAAIRALQAIKRTSRIDLHTDSEYLRKGVTEWMPRWQRNGWRKADGKPVSNQDLWLELARAVGVHDVHWHWVPGHAGHPDNERVDAAARAAIDGTGAGSDAA